MRGSSTDETPAASALRGLIFDASRIARLTGLVALQRFFIRRPATGTLRAGHRPRAARGGCRGPRARSRSARWRGSLARWGGAGRPRASPFRWYRPPGAHRSNGVDAAVPALAALGIRLRSGHHGHRRGVRAAGVSDWERPLRGAVALMTGAARGIGAAIGIPSRATAQGGRHRRPRRRRSDGRQAASAASGADGGPDLTSDAPEGRRGLAGRRGRPCAQRRRHPRPHDREDAARALERS